MKVVAGNSIIPHPLFCVKLFDFFGLFFLFGVLERASLGRVTGYASFK